MFYAELGMKVSLVPERGGILSPPVGRVIDRNQGTEFTWPGGIEGPLVWQNAHRPVLLQGLSKP